ncbi:hypothetical protein GCM10012286_65510 [Streptomyces lasiicapitis]|uniref:Uncharacterized protein n=1 Tax=Streptomyces lasiicapitis TaxID=1923961 RepID=A0ABQ2MRB8_9ACTN|nr:hypothetical protein GCM10012286_65510 [Streptomyces lasiicapitis]
MRVLARAVAAVLVSLLLMLSGTQEAAALRSGPVESGGASTAELYVGESGAVVTAQRRLSRTARGSTPLGVQVRRAYPTLVRQNHPCAAHQPKVLWHERAALAAARAHHRVLRC